MENQRQISWDRISALPEDTIEKIVSHMPIRDALRTSILSKKWRYCWTRMPKLVFDANLVNVSPDIDKTYKYKVVNAIFHVLLLHKGPILEFSLFVNEDFFSEIDQIILYLSRSNNIKKFIYYRRELRRYVLPCSLFTLQGLEHLDLSACSFELPLVNKGFRMLKTLCFRKVYISEEMLLGFLTNCPLLEEFTWIGDDQVELTECTFIELFKCLPSVQVLIILELRVKRFDVGGMPHKLPTLLVHLRILELNVCFLELSYVLCVISSSPNLEKIIVHMCNDHDGECIPQTFKNSLDDEDYTGLNLDHLKEMEITCFHNHAPELELVKLIMSKSPVLKKARIVLDYYVSVHEEVKMLRDLLHVPFPRASPSAKFIIERPKDFQGKEMYLS